MAYTIKFMIKKGEAANIEPVDYAVMPLEGQWWADNMDDFVSLDKDNWLWKVMIAQPDLVNTDLINVAKDKLRKKKILPALELLQFEEIEDGLSAQIMHLGPYSAEGPTIKELHQYIVEQGYVRSGLHREIYLGDFRRTAPEKLKTIIRQPMAKQ
jgi:hypothetical protein